MYGKAVSQVGLHIGLPLLEGLLHRIYCNLAGDCRAKVVPNSYCSQTSLSLPEKLNLKAGIQKC